MASHPNWIRATSCQTTSYLVLATFATTVCPSDAWLVLCVVSFSPDATSFQAWVGLGGTGAGRDDIGLTEFCRGVAASEKNKVNNSSHHFPQQDIHVKKSGGKNAFNYFDIMWLAHTSMKKALGRRCLMKSAVFM